MSALAIKLRRVEPAILMVVALTVLIIAVGFFVNERFGTARNFLNVFEQAAPLGFVALGQTFAVLVGGIDLSIGSVVTASNVMLAGLVNGNDAMMIPALFVVLAFGAAFGFMNGWITVTTGVHPLIVTLGTASVLQGLVLLYTLQPTGSVPFWFEEFAYGRVMGIPISGVVLIVCFVAVGWFLKYRSTGRAVYAVGGNPEAARLSGIRNNRITIMAYGASGFFAALAGAYFVSRTGVGDPRVGDPFTLASITPVIVGGCLLGGGRGNVAGVLLGVAMISLLNNLLNYMNTSTFLQWVIQGLIIIVAVAVYVDRSKKL
ncbi:MAG: ABC transporter permease [Pseudomonadota bacterium]